jgi:protein-disulfide isomerase
MNRFSATARNCLIAVLASLAWLLAGGVQLLAQTAAATNSPAIENSVEQTIHDYILAHPEILIESLQRAKQKDDNRVAAIRKSMVASFKKYLIEDPNDPIFGNPAGDVTLVEFFDYRCPYCRQIEPALQTLIKEDPGLRIVQKEFPILGPASVFAARVALAAQKQGKHAMLHEALMARKPNIDEATVLKVAGEAGLDLDRIKVDMVSHEVDTEIEKTAQIAKALRLNGTPSFVAGTEVVPVVTDLPTLRAIIADVRRDHDLN